jgi:hypothetical protein
MALKVGIITGGTFAGWVVAHDEGQSFTTTARPVLDADGRVHFVQVLIAGTTAGPYGTPQNFVSPPTLRDVPLAPLTSWVAERGDRFEELGFPLPVIGATTEPISDLEDLEARTTALRDAEPPRRRPRNLRITGATERRKPPRFYERVADLYRRLVETHDHHPAKTIADANPGVSVEVVHQWIKKCRRDGLLGATVAGRASAGVPAVFTQAIPPKRDPSTTPRVRRKRRRSQEGEER